MVNQTKRQIGEAYAFFDCRASKEQIEAELPTIRECVKTPSNLELSLTEGVDKFWKNNAPNMPIELGDVPNAMSILQDAQDSGMRYVLSAKYSGATNKQTADELAGILNQAYQSPLYVDGERFRGNIVYRENDRYVLRE